MLLAGCNILMGHLLLASYVTRNDRLFKGIILWVTKKIAMSGKDDVQWSDIDQAASNTNNGESRLTLKVLIMPFPWS